MKRKEVVGKASGRQHSKWPLGWLAPLVLYCSRESSWTKEPSSWLKLKLMGR